MWRAGFCILRINLHLILQNAFFRAFQGARRCLEACPGRPGEENAFVRADGAGRLPAVKNASGPFGKENQAIPLWGAAGLSTVRYPLENLLLRASPV